VDTAFTVHLPVDTGSVPFVRGLCRQALVHLQIGRVVIDEIALALTEACANVVQHVVQHAVHEVEVAIDDRLDFRHESDGRHRVTLEKRLTQTPPLRLVGPA
jgi:serine/threonine-protein kinase RsbW